MEFPTPEQFRAWLAATAPQEMVGEAGNAHRCPLAEYLRAQGAPSPIVFSEEWGEDCPVRPSRDLPLWAIDFEMRIDFECEDEVTAAAALRVLAEVMEPAPGRPSPSPDQGPVGGDGVRGARP